MKSLQSRVIALVGSAFLIGLLVDTDEEGSVRNIDHETAESSTSRMMADQQQNASKEEISGLNQVRSGPATKPNDPNQNRPYHGSEKDNENASSSLALEKEKRITRMLSAQVGARDWQALDIASIEGYLSTNQLKDFSSFRKMDFKKIKEIEPDIAGTYEGVINFNDSSSWIIKLALHIDSIEEPLRGELHLKIMDENEAVLMNSHLQGSLNGLIRSFEATKRGFSLILFSQNSKSGKLLQLFFKKTEVDDVVIGNFYRPLKQQQGFTRPDPLILVRVG